MKVTHDKKNKSSYVVKRDLDEDIYDFGDYIIGNDLLVHKSKVSNIDKLKLINPNPMFSDRIDFLIKQAPKDMWEDFHQVALTDVNCKLLHGGYTHKLDKKRSYVELFIGHDSDAVHRYITFERYEFLWGIGGHIRLSSKGYCHPIYFADGDSDGNWFLAGCFLDTVLIERKLALNKK